MQTVPTAVPTRLDVVLRHLWLHLAGGTALSAVALPVLTVVMATGPVGQRWTDMWTHAEEMLLALLGLFTGALLVGIVRIPALEWLGRQAWQQRWPVALLLLASAALFIAPILLPFCFGEGGRLIGRVSLIVSVPYLVSYVAATYWLRRQLCQPQPVVT